MTKYLMMVSVALLISACAARAPVHQPSSELDQRIVKEMHIPNDKSRVVFFLGKSIGAIDVDSNIPMDIFIDGKLIGNIGRRSDMVVTDLLPGKHILLANGMPNFDTDITYQAKPTHVSLVAGKQSFYRVTLKDSSTTPAQKILGISSPLSDSSTYAVSLTKDNNGIDDLTYHTVVAFYNEASAKQKVAKPMEQVSKSNKKTVTKPQEKSAMISDDIEVKMIKIKDMYKKGLITQSEYDSKRKSLLESY